MFTVPHFFLLTLPLNREWQETPLFEHLPPLRNATKINFSRLGYTSNNTHNAAFHRSSLGKVW